MRIAPLFFAQLRLKPAASAAAASPSAGAGRPPSASGSVSSVKSGASRMSSASALSRDSGVYPFKGNDGKITALKAEYDGGGRLNLRPAYGKYMHSKDGSMYRVRSDDERTAWREGRPSSSSAAGAGGARHSQ